MKIPVVYAYLYMKIKEDTKGNIIDYGFLKQKVSRVLLCSIGELGGNRKGIPKNYLPDIIQDMIDFALIKKICRLKYQLNNINYKRRLRQPII